MKNLSKFCFFLLFFVVLITASCKKERDPQEYPEGTLVTFVGEARPGCVMPMTILGVSYRSPKELKYFAKDANGNKMNDLSEFEIKRL